MNLENYVSFVVTDDDHLLELNDLLEQTYSDNKAIVSAKRRYKKDLLVSVKFKYLDTSRKHILIKLIHESKACGSITIYKDLNNQLPIEEYLKISLARIREKNITICEVGRLAIINLHKQNYNSLLILFCEVINHCFENGIQLLVTQAFFFNHQHFYRFGFRYFKGFNKGCYDLEFDTICYPMYISVLNIYRTFKHNLLDSKKVGIFIDENSEFKYALNTEIQNIDVNWENNTHVNSI